MNNTKIPKNLSKFSKKELDSFFSDAKSVLKNQAFTILSNTSKKSFSRALISVPKRYGTAPERNKIKRQIKSIFIEESLFNLQKDFAFLIRPKTKELLFSELKSMILKAIK